MFHNWAWPHVSDRIPLQLLQRNRFRWVTGQVRSTAQSEVTTHNPFLAKVFSLDKRGLGGKDKCKLSNPQEGSQQKETILLMKCDGCAPCPALRRTLAHESRVTMSLLEKPPWGDCHITSFIHILIVYIIWNGKCPVQIVHHQQCLLEAFHLAQVSTS